MTSTTANDAATDRVAEDLAVRVPTGRPVFPLLDGLRAVAVLCVVATHAAFFAGLYVQDGIAGRLAARFEVGVAIFFVISGFVLYRPFVAAHLTDRASPALGRYVLRRLARIVPAYWIALTAIALLRDTPGVLEPGGWRYYLFAQVYWRETANGGITQAWSLCVEMAFYLALPAWALIVRGIARRTDHALRVELAGVAALVVGSLVWTVAALAAQRGAPVAATPRLLSLPGYLDQLGVGMALAALSVRAHELGRPELRPLAVLARRPWVGVVAATSAFVLCALGLGISSRFLAPMDATQYALRHVLLTAVGASLVAVAVTSRSRRGGVRGTLGSPLIMWLGTLSYGIYLWHDAALGQMADWGLTPVAGIPAVVWWPLVALGFAVVLAAVSWYGMERRLLSVAQRVTTAPSGRDARHEGRR